MHLVNCCYTQTINTTCHSQKHSPFPEHIFLIVPIIYSMSDFTHISTFTLQPPHTNYILQTFNLYFYLCIKHIKERTICGKIIHHHITPFVRAQYPKNYLQSLLSKAMLMSLMPFFLFIFYCHLLYGSFPYLFLNSEIK